MGNPAEGGAGAFGSNCQRRSFWRDQWPRNNKGLLQATPDSGEATKMKRMKRTSCRTVKTIFLEEKDIILCSSLNLWSYLSQTKSNTERKVMLKDMECFYEKNGDTKQRFYRGRISLHCLLLWLRMLWRLKVWKQTLDSKHQKTRNIWLWKNKMFK